LYLNNTINYNNRENIDELAEEDDAGESEGE